MRSSNRTFFAALLSGASFFALCTAASAAPQATGHLILEGGRAYPQNDLTQYLTPGTAYHLNIFGGAKVDVKFIGAVGLGWDFTYSEHTVKDSTDSHYRRFTWDWFHIPISLGFLYIEPGLSWVVTNVSIPELDLKAESIRPEALIEGGARVGLFNDFAITAGGRSEWTWIDQQRTLDDNYLNITGHFLSWFAGCMLYF